MTAVQAVSNALPGPSAWVGTAASSATSSSDAGATALRNSGPPQTSTAASGASPSYSVQGAACKNAIVAQTQVPRRADELIVTCNGGNAPQQPVLWAVVLLLLGGILTHALSHRREVRKECRSEIDACCKLAADLLERGRQYMASTDSQAADSRKAAAQIRFDFQRLVKRAEQLQRKHGGFRLEDPLDRLSESLTGGDFESASRVPLQPDAERLIALEVDTHTLIDAMEEGFSQSFDGLGAVFPAARLRSRRRSRT